MGNEKVLQITLPIPEKKYFKIGEASKISGLEPHVLRFWESQFKTLSPRKDSGNQRLYTRKDIETILYIKKLLYQENYTIAGAKKKIDGKDSIENEKSEASLKEELLQVKKELQEIRELLD